MIINFNINLLYLLYKTVQILYVYDGILNYDTLILRGLIETAYIKLKFHN